MITVKEKSLNQAEETLQHLLDKVSKTGEDLIHIKRSPERLPADISASQKKKPSDKKKS
jgi:hypothetical protein